MADLTPLPGLPDLLEQDAVTYGRTADAIQDAIGRIRALASDSFESDAVSALSGAQGDVIGDVSKAYARYRAAGDALLGYAKALRVAQEDANAAIQAWHSADGGLQQLAGPVADATERSTTPGPDQGMAAGDLARLTGEQQSLQAMQAQALQRWHDAVAAKDAAAKAAAIAINAGNRANDLNDDLWDELGDLVKVINIINAFVREVLKIVSLIMTILAIVFVILAIFFQPFAAVAAALFGYAQLVNLAIALLALLQFLMDGFHLMDLVVVGIAVVAAFGGSVVGKVLGTATDAAVNTALSGFGEAAAKAAGTAASQAVTTAVREVTNAAVQDVLDLGSSDAKALYADVGPAASGFLSGAMSGQVSAATAEAKLIGGWVGSDFQAGIAETGLPDLAHGALAGFGQVVGPVFDQIGGGLQAVQHGYDVAHGAIDSGIDRAVGAAGGFTGDGKLLGSVLGSNYQAPDLGQQAKAFVDDLGVKAVGAIPGGTTFVHAFGLQIGGMTDSMQQAASHGGVPTTTAGTRR